MTSVATGCRLWAHLASSWASFLDVAFFPHFFYVSTVMCTRSIAFISWLQLTSFHYSCLVFNPFELDWANNISSQLIDWLNWLNSCYIWLVLWYDGKLWIRIELKLWRFDCSPMKLRRSLLDYIRGFGSDAISSFSSYSSSSSFSSSSYVFCPFSFAGKFLVIDQIYEVHWC